MEKPSIVLLWWAHQDLNLEPTDYESAALTVELWAREGQSIRVRGQGLGVSRRAAGFELGVGLGHTNERCDLPHGKPTRDGK